MYHRSMIRTELFEVEDFVRSTRRWYRQGKSREMQEKRTPAEEF